MESIELILVEGDVLLEVSIVRGIIRRRLNATNPRIA